MVDVRFTIPTATLALDMEVLKQAGISLRESAMNATIAYLRLGDFVSHRKGLFFAHEGLMILEYELPRTGVNPFVREVESDLAGKALSNLRLEDELYAMLVHVLFPDVSPSQYSDPITKRAVEASCPVIWANYIDLVSLCLQGVLIIVGQDEKAEKQYNLPGFRMPEPGTHGY